MTNRPRISRREFYAVTLLAVMNLFLFADQNLMAPNLTQMAQQFGFNETECDLLNGESPMLKGAVSSEACDYAVSRAIEDGEDMRGYYCCSLMDDFEWAEGYEMKLGLFAVDFETQRRTLRQGSRVYREMIQ